MLIKLIKKIVKGELNIKDIFSDFYIRFQSWWSGLLGTSIFKIKANLFGVEYGKNLRCYGAVHVLRGPKSRITIGKNVWIGLQAIILKGANVGDNSIIAAGSVVSGEIPANCLAGGIPAKVIRRLDE